MKSRKEINKNKIGLVGHSEGGIIAPVIASKSKDISFIVLLAGPGIQGDKLLLLQKEAIEKQMGISDAEIQKGKEIFKGAYEIITTSKSNDENLKNEVENYFRSKINVDQSTANNLAAELTKPWMYNSLKLDPIIFLQKVKCPVLAINGSKDLQVPAEVNLNSIKKTLEEAGNKKVTVKILPNLNHLFQECTTGLPTEYGTIEQTFSPTALEEISNWLLLQTK